MTKAKNPKPATTVRELRQLASDLGLEEVSIKATDGGFKVVWSPGEEVQYYYTAASLEAELRFNGE